MSPIAAVTALIGVSFLASGTQTALLSLGAGERRRLEDTALGKWFVERLERGSDFETTVLTANVATSVAVVVFAARVLATRFPDHPWWLIVVVTPLLVLLSEVTARALAFRFAPGWVRGAMWSILAVHFTFTPVRWVIVGIAHAVSKVLGASSTPMRGVAREAEIMSLIEKGAKVGSVAQREREIVEAVFDFGELTVGRLMTPRPDMFAISLDMAWGDILETCREAGYSRVPVLARGSDEVIGVLLLKDLLRFSAAGGASAHQLRSLLLPPVWIPQTKPANAMLREFLLTKQHMAFVVDEHGTVAGLVTLDDLLSELVGEFLDKDDEADETLIHQFAPGQYRVKAWMDIDDFVEETTIDVPRDGYNTLGGFVFHVLGRLPHKGDMIQHNGQKFTVTAMEGRRIAELLIETDSPETEPQTAAEAPRPDGQDGAE